MRWRLIIHGPAEGAFNMAVDHALLESVQADERPVLRLYRWQPACLSLGRNQPAVLRYDAARAAARGIDIVRRPTGGLAVYHDRELTYAAILPAGLLGSPRATYARVNRALALGLRRLGVPATASPRPARRALALAGAALDETPGSLPCFQQAAEGEVLANGRKIAGSAQCCEARTILQHGSILIAGDQSEVLELEQSPARPFTPPACTGIEAEIGRVPAWTELEQAIVDGFREECAADFEPDTLTAAESARVQVLLRHYRSEEWTWRR